MSRKIQYFHNIPEFKTIKGFTVAVYVPLPKEIRSMAERFLNNDVSVNLLSAYSVLSPQDQYSRKKGREITSTRLQDKNYVVTSLMYSGGTMRMILSNNEMDIMLEHADNKSNVHFVYAELK